MAEVVNLRLARKAKRRAVADDAAAQNRAMFGRSKAERTKVAAELTSHDRALDGTKREH